MYNNADENLQAQFNENFPDVVETNVDQQQQITNHIAQEVYDNIQNTSPDDLIDFDISNL